MLLQGDNVVQLVVLCADKPTATLLKRVAKELPIQLKKVSEEHKYTFEIAPAEGAVLVTDGQITVKVSLTSPLLREAQGNIFLFSQCKHIATLPASIYLFNFFRENLFVSYLYIYVETRKFSSCILFANSIFVQPILKHLF